MKIGFIVGPQQTRWNDTYYDKFQMNKTRRPWLENVPSKYYLNEWGKKYTDKSVKPYIRIDIAAAYALMNLLKDTNHTLTIVPAKEISVKRLRQFDLVFNQFYDVLVVPFLKKFEKDGYPHAKLLSIYQECSDIIYPPMEYHELIIDKCKYYSLLKERGINVAPSLCVKKEDYRSPDTLTAVSRFVKKHKAGTLFVKPVHGTDSTGVKVVGDDYDVRMENLRLKNELMRHLQVVFKNKQYPAVVLQKYLKEFEKTTPQIRMYFMGTKYLYSVLTQNGDTFRPKSEVSKSFDSVSTMEFDVNKCLMKHAKEVFKVIQPFFGKMPMLMTRLDFGCCLSSKDECGKYFINEIEFAGGNYVHTDAGKDRRFMYEQKIAQQLVKVIRYKAKKMK